MHKPNDLHIYALTPPINYPKWKLSSFLTRLPTTTNCSKNSSMQGYIDTFLVTFRVSK